MAKSRTKRKAVNKPQLTEVIAATEATSLYIGVWAKQEAERLLKKEPIIIPTKNGFHVGKFTVKNANHTWHVYNVWDEFVNAFSSKQSAVSWCILEHIGRIIQSVHACDNNFHICSMCIKIFTSCISIHISALWCVWKIHVGYRQCTTALLYYINLSLILLRK